MKKHLFITLLFVFICSSFFAQTDKKSKEKIKTLKVSFLTQELDLTAEVAQKFWPIYNKHQESLDILRNLGRTEIRKKLKNIGGFDALSEEESKSFVNSKIELDKKILVEKESFLKSISKVLSYKKILKLQLSEREFARKLMHKYGRKLKNK
jgi:Skp family chaperone for outer membrane proteins